MNPTEVGRRKQSKIINKDLVLRLHTEQANNNMARSHFQTISAALMDTVFPIS